VVDDLPVVGPRNPIELHGLGLVDEIEQGREGVTEVEAPATAVTDVEYALQLREQGGLVVEFGTLPVERMALRCVQASFAAVGPRAGLGGAADGGIGHDGSDGARADLVSWIALWMDFAGAERMPGNCPATHDRPHQAMRPVAFMLQRGSAMLSP